MSEMLSKETPEADVILQVRGTGGIEARDMSALTVDRRARVGHARGLGPVCMRCGCAVGERSVTCPACGSGLLWADEELGALHGRLDGCGDEGAVLDWGVRLAESAQRDFEGGAASVCVFGMREGSLRGVPPTLVHGGASRPPSPPLLPTERVASLGHSEYAVYDMRDAASVEAVRRAMQGRLALFERECDVERADAQRSLLEAFSAASREGVGDDGGSGR